MKKIIKNVTDTSFEFDILKSKKPVLLDFWASWCEPCKMVMPIFEKVALDFINIIHFMKLNIVESKEITKIFTIKSIPTLVFFKKGIVISRRTGSFSESELIFFINKNFNK